MKTLEDDLVKGYDILQLYKEEGDQIRKEIDVMMNLLIEKTEKVEDDLKCETRSDYKELKYNIKTQRDENELLYKGLKHIHKDTVSQKQKIAFFKSKIEELEQHVGIINIENYAEEK
jgi:septal ring factor EnvC (AmiA/AmiB activator)